MTRYAPLWQQAGTYSASLDRDLLGTLWPSGGAAGNPPVNVNNTMNVSIPAGQCAVALAAGQGSALCTWDAAEVVTLPAAPGAGTSRYDVVICQVRDNALDAGPNNDFIFTYASGTAAASPTVPATPNNAYAICNVLVPGAAANLNTATLTDRRGLGLAVPALSIHSRVRLNANTAVSQGAVIPYNQVDHDPMGLYSMTTRAWTIPAAGYYLIAGVLAGTGSANQTLVVVLNKGGTGVTTFFNLSSPAALWGQAFMGLELFAVGDQITLQSNGTVPTLIGATGAGLYTHAQLQYLHA